MPVIEAPVFNYIHAEEPRHKEHIVVTDGNYYRSGYWIRVDGEDGYLYPDPDEAFQFVFWAPTGKECGYCK